MVLYIISAGAAFLIWALLMFLFKKTSNNDQSITIKEIYIYPIKSCGGIKVNRAQISKRGLLHDRMFALVDKKLSVISIRCHPKMATIETSFSADGHHLIVSAPNMASISVLLCPPTDQATKFSTEIWDSSVEVYEVNDAVSTWFSSYLGENDIKLVRMCDNFKRHTEKQFSLDGQLSLADELPFVMVSEGAIPQVNSILATSKYKVSMRNFRPNFVISGCEAFAEDKWRSVRFGGMELTVTKPCSRCSLPNIDPETGIRDNNLSVTKALRQFRTGAHLGLKKEWENDVFFGVSLDHHSGSWSDNDGEQVRVGDIVTVYYGDH